MKKKTIIAVLKLLRKASEDGDITIYPAIDCLEYRPDSWSDNAIKDAAESAARFDKQQK